MTTARDRFRDYRWRRENEKARSLASQREDLIDVGIDPNELLVPIAPIRPIVPVRPPRRAADTLIDSVPHLPIPADRDDWEADPSESDWVITPDITPRTTARAVAHQINEAKHLRELARVWIVVAAACLAAAGGAISAAGGLLVIHDALTWHTILSLLTGVVYVCAVGGAAGHARNLYRRAREHDGGDDD